MEDMFWKFPHLGQQIIKKLSNKNIAKGKKVARSWERFIINEKFYKQKVRYEIKQKKRDHFGWTPLHEAAWYGNLQECKLIIDNVEDKNPLDNDGDTPLFSALVGGHLSVFQLIFNNVEDKNPMINDGRTLLHHAASKGHFEIFKLIFEEIEDKNPLDDFKNTPLHWAAKMGHLEICKYIVSKVEDKNLAINSKNIFGQTPIDIASNFGHQQVEIYLRSIDEN